MFGFSFGEIVLLLLVGIVVVGPRRLPSMMRTAGQWVAKLRRMSFELRTQSGIDDLIRQEGIERELAELRSLSRVNVIDTLVTPMLSAPASSLAAAAATATSAPKPATGALAPRIEPLREREYPLVGCDAYGALPDDAAPYVPDVAASDEAERSPRGGASDEYPLVGCDAYGALPDDREPGIASGPPA